MFVGTCVDVCGLVYVANGVCLFSLTVACVVM